MKQTYSILKAGPEDNTELKVIMSGLPNRGFAISRAKVLKATHAHEGSWAPSYYIAILETV